MSNTIADPTSHTLAVAQAAFEAQNYALLPSLIIGVSLYSSEIEEVEAFLVEAASCPNEYVRGNALLGLGHLARRSGLHNRATAEAMVSAGLLDVSPYVRGQAQSAQDDISQFRSRGSIGA